MRRDIVHIGAGELSYAIREIVDQAKRLEALGVDMTWENIGDPVQEPDWIKDIVADLVHTDSSYGYCPTRGELATREFIAERVNGRGRLTFETLARVMPQYIERSLVKAL